MTYTSIKDALALSTSNLSDSGLRAAIKSGKMYKEHFFRQYNAELEPDDTIDTPYICIIDGIRFNKQVEVADYCDVTRQAVSSAKQRKQPMINGYLVEWKT